MTMFRLHFRQVANCFPNFGVIKDSFDHLFERRAEISGRKFSNNSNNFEVYSENTIIILRQEGGQRREDRVACWQVIYQHL